MKQRMFILLLSALAFTSAWCVQHAQAATQKTNDTNGYVEGKYFFPAWQTGWNFNKGSFTRTWQTSNNGNNVDYLWINLSQVGNNNYVGFDAGVGRNINGGTKVGPLTNTNGNKINRGVNYAFTDNLSPNNNDAYWWQGPKTIISSTQYYSGLNGQYECYIVDSSNKSRNWIVNRLGLQYVSQGNYNGSTYYHYKVKLGQINQIWSIRGNYRNSGWVSTNWIMRQWKLSGLLNQQDPNKNANNLYCLGWKVNVETAGNYNNGSNCGFSYLNLPWN